MRLTSQVLEHHDGHPNAKSVSDARLSKLLDLSHKSMVANHSHLAIELGPSSLDFLLNIVVTIREVAYPRQVPSGFFLPADLE